MGSHLRSDSTWLHRLSSPQVKRARTVSRLRIFYIIMIRAFRLECSFCIRSQSRHLTAYDALLLRLTTKGRSRSQKRRPKHVPRTFYFLQPMLVLIRFLINITTTKAISLTSKNVRERIFFDDEF